MERRRGWVQMSLGFEISKFNCRLQIGDLYPFLGSRCWSSFKFGISVHIPDLRSQSVSPHERQHAFLPATQANESQTRPNWNLKPSNTIISKNHDFDFFNSSPSSESPMIENILEKSPFNLRKSWRWRLIMKRIHLILNRTSWRRQISTHESLKRNFCFDFSIWINNKNLLLSWRCKIIHQQQTRFSLLQDSFHLSSIGNQPILQIYLRS